MFIYDPSPREHERLLNLGYSIHFLLGLYLCPPFQQETFCTQTQNAQAQSF